MPEGEQGLTAADLDLEGMRSRVRELEGYARYLLERWRADAAEQHQQSNTRAEALTLQRITKLKTVLGERD